MLSPTVYVWYTLANFIFKLLPDLVIISPTVRLVAPITELPALKRDESPTCIM